MIAKLRGLIDTIGEDFCIIDVNGVGYLVFASNRTLSKLVRGNEASLYIETIVREDSIFMVLLISLKNNGLLPSRRFKVLAQKSGAQYPFCASQEANLHRRLQQETRLFLNGVGPKACSSFSNWNSKTKWSQSQLQMLLGQIFHLMMKNLLLLQIIAENSKGEDAISALVNLGYQRIEAYRAINEILAENAETYARFD